MTLKFGRKNLDIEAKDIAKVMLWMEEISPGSRLKDLEKRITEKYGDLKWDSQMGYGEGSISCEVNGLRGWSGGLCTSEEALINLALKLIG